MYNHQKTTLKTKAANIDSIFDVDGSYFSMSRYNVLTQLPRISVEFGLALLLQRPTVRWKPPPLSHQTEDPLTPPCSHNVVCFHLQVIPINLVYVYDAVGQTIPTFKSCCLTNLSGLGAHSSDSNGDLDMTVAQVWMSGWWVQTL